MPKPPLVPIVAGGGCGWHDFIHMDCAIKSIAENLPSSMTVSLEDVPELRVEMILKINPLFYVRAHVFYIDLFVIFSRNGENVFS